MASKYARRHVYSDIRTKTNLKHKGRLNNVQKLSFYLKKPTPPHYEYNLGNAVYETIAFYFESRNEKFNCTQSEKGSCWMLCQSVYVDYYMHKKCDELSLCQQWELYINIAHLPN